MVYKAFGLKILSEIPLPELPLVSRKADTPDVFIEIADLTKLWRELPAQQGKFFIKENMVMFQISNTATFCIKEGKSIIVSPMLGADEDQIRLFILGTCMGALLMQRRVLPLHGSAIAIDGKAYAIIGKRGAGKSTLTSAFLSRGYQFLSDDVIAVDYSPDGACIMVTPSYPQQKLWKESLDQFGLETSQYRSIFQRENKYVVPVPSKYFTEPLPLAGIFELVKTENGNIEIDVIRGLERLRTIRSHTFRNVLIDHLGLAEWHFNISIHLANQADLFQLRRPVIGFTANELASLILTCTKKEVEAL